MLLCNISARQPLYCSYTVTRFYIKYSSCKKVSCKMACIILCVFGVINNYASAVHIPIIQTRVLGVLMKFGETMTTTKR